MIKKVIAPLKNAVNQMVLRALVTIVDDTTTIQSVQATALAGEIISDVERFQNFGFSSNPPANSEALIVFVGGAREHPIMLGVENRATRKKNLEIGESIQYTADGTFIHLKKGGKIRIENSIGKELIALISEHQKAIIDARVSTLAGPVPLLSIAPNRLFPIILADVDTFKDV